MALMATEIVNMHANNKTTSIFATGIVRTALTVASLFFLGQTLAQDAIPIDKIIAIVDDDVVLQSEFDMRWEQIEQQINLQTANSQTPGPSEAQLEQIRSNLLDQLILENIQMQMARRAGVRVDDNQLNQAMIGIARQNNMEFEQFRQVLESQGLYLQTREQLRKDILLQQLQMNAVNQRIDITRQEVENYLRSEAGQQDIAPEFMVAHILIEHADGPEQARREELADFLYQQLLDGAELQQFVAAGQVSGIPLRGGVLEGWRKQETLPSYFREVVPNLKLGEISEPFESSSGLHIVQVINLRGGANLEIEQFHVRHLLISPNEIRTESQAENLISELYERIQNGEDLGDLARVHTDDDTSIVAGGDLDWITFGQFPPDFLAVVQNLEIGKMSEPTRLETGWHIIELLDTRLEDLTDENMRYQAEQILRQRKFDNELENWLTEMRDTAYVDIKIEE
jgi:peptidyl-prolyl cis-trans isomerase SurA